MERLTGWPGSPGANDRVDWIERKQDKPLAFVQNLSGLWRERILRLANSPGRRLGAQQMPGDARTDRDEKKENTDFASHTVRLMTI